MKSRLLGITIALFCSPVLAANNNTAANCAAQFSKNSPQYQFCQTAGAAVDARITSVINEFPQVNPDKNLSFTSNANTAPNNTNNQ